MKRVCWVLVVTLIATIAVACNAPGEPPSHPSKADYHDLIRRETDKSQSAIATAQVVVGQLRRQWITKNYSTVTARQSDADLAAVITDLRQITAPTPQLRRNQSHVQHVLVNAAATVTSLPPNWNNQPRLRRISHQLAITAKQVTRAANRLS